MKKWILMSVLMLTTVTIAFAQPAKPLPQKIGFANLRNVLDSLPQKDSAVAQLKVLNDYFSQDLAEMKKEYDAKLSEYDLYTKGANIDPLVKELKEAALKGLEEKIYNTNQKYQELIQVKQNELVQPIMDSIKASVKVIAKQKSYTSVIDISNENLIYNANSADDLTNSVIRYMRAQAKRTPAPKPVVIPGRK